MTDSSQSRPSQWLDESTVHPPDSADASRPIPPDSPSSYVRRLEDAGIQELNLATANVYNQLGRGGDANVFRAQYRKRMIALKRLRRDGPYGDRLDRMTNEVIRQNLVVTAPSIIGADLHDESFAMGTICDASLADVLEDSDSDLTPEERFAIGMQCIEAVRGSIAAEVVHRDIKPSNLLIHEASGKTLVTDFGLSVGQGDDPQEDYLVGTPPYMAPEQIQNRRSADASIDVFSLGLVLFELLHPEHKKLAGLSAGSTAPSALLNAIVSQTDFKSLFRSVARKYRFRVRRAIVAFFKECLAHEPASRSTIVTAQERWTNIWKKI